MRDEHPLGHVNDQSVRIGGLIVGVAYLILSLFMAFAQLSRSDRLHLPAVSKRVWVRSRLPMIVAALLTAFFAIAEGVLGPTSIVAANIWMAALLGWSFSVVELDLVCRNKTVRQLPRVQRGLLLGLVILLCGLSFGWLVDPSGVVHWVIVTNIILDLAVIVLCENIMRNAEREILWHLSLPSVAAGGLALVSLLLYAGVILGQRVAEPLIGARLVFLLMVLPLFAIGAMRANRWRPRRLQLSKNAAFYSASLILGGSFMLVLGVVAALVHDARFGLSAVVEWAIILAGLLVAAIVVSSGSARSRLMVLLRRHFAAAPYDYRQEWLRCIATLSIDRGGSVVQRAIKALADTADAPSGIFLDHDRERAAFRFGEGWNTALEIATIDHDKLRFEENASQSVIELDPEGETAPFWLAVALPDPINAVSLGVVLLSRPRAAQKLDDEMATLLAVVACEVSLVMAESRAADALAVARKFEAAGKRFSFVAHDIKNVANQLGLVIDNAQRHMADPDFQADLISTVRESVEKIRAMIWRLDQADPAGTAQFDVHARLQEILARRDQVRLDVADGQSAISIDPLSFDMIINHLLDNAQEASVAPQSVWVTVRHEPGWVTIGIVDHGCGMSARFVREHLFKPFSSDKTLGFGLGAFQARELIVQAGGSLAVTSAQGVGTTMTVRLPALGVIKASPPPAWAGINHGS